MKTLFTMFTMIAFCASPAAFGAGQNAQEIYKNTYINVMQGKDMGQSLKTLMDSAKANGLTVKDVLEAAVQKGYMSQDQLNTVLDVAAKNPQLGDKSMADKVAKGQLSAKDVAALSDALQGKVNGAAYWCGRYGCHYGYGYYGGGAALLLIIIIAIALTPVYY